jgi:phage shock protein A
MFAELVEVLDAEKVILEELVLGVEAEIRFLTGERFDLLAQANRELQRISRRLKDAELYRALAAGELESHLGLEPMAALAAIAEKAPEPWRGLLDARRDELVDLTKRLERSTAVLARRISDKIGELEEPVKSAERPQSAEGHATTEA